MNREASSATRRQDRGLPDLRRYFGALMQVPGNQAVSVFKTATADIALVSGYPPTLTSFRVFPHSPDLAAVPR